jgi:hypothetical protein
VSGAGRPGTKAVVLSLILAPIADLLLTLSAVSFLPPFPRLFSLSIHSTSFSRSFSIHNLSLNFSMKITQVYAAAAGGIFIVLILVNIRRDIVQLLETYSLLKPKLTHC